MKWTDVKPSKPGTYWFKELRRTSNSLGALYQQLLGRSQYLDPVLVKIFSHVTCVHCNHAILMEEYSGSRYALRQGGQWSDAPIPEPEED